MADTAIAALQLAASPLLRRGAGAALPLPVRDALLLAWLAIEGPTPRARVAQLLWPDSGAQAARNALRQRLFQLKKLAGIDLVGGQETLVLADGVLHDLETSDDVLAGLEPEPGTELAGWLARQRQRRRERLRESLAELAAMAERSQDWADALGHARELLALDPLAEDAHRRLMRLHYLAGDRAAALLAFDACERILKNEVGARPSPETLALLRTLEVATAAPAPTGVPAAVLRPPRLLGRDAQIAQLARAGREPLTLLLRGEAGMGKSRLIDAFLCVQDTATVAAGARPGDAAVPYALAGRWLRALIAAHRLELDTSQREALARLLPELGAAALAQREQMMEALEVLFTQALQRGLRCLVIDDLQFADAASVALLQALAGRGDAGWIVALRPAELGEAARDFCDAMQRLSSTQVLDLPPLQASEVAELIDSLGLDGFDGLTQATALRAHTGGNPLFVLETIKAALLQPGRTLVPAGGNAPAAIDWPAAASVLRLIQQRLARLSPAALRLARCAAVAGQDLSSALAAAVLGLPVLDLADAWSELEAAQVLQDTGFAHDLIAEAALASVPDAVARPLHAAVAAWLEARDGEPARVAEHWLAAHEELRAVPSLLAAALRARQLWRHEEAGGLFGRAGDILRAAGRERDAFDAYFHAAEAQTESCVDGRIRRWVGDLDALAVDDVQRASAACVHVALWVEQRRFDEARRVATEGVALARSAGAADIEVELLWSLTALDWERRELAGAARHAEAALRRLADVVPGAARLDLADTHFKLLHALGVILGSLGHYADGDRRLEEAIEVASRRRGQPWMLGIAASLAASAYEQGDMARALRWEAKAIADDDRDGVYANTRSNTLASCLAIRACSGDLGTALVYAERAAALCAQGLVRNDVAALARRAALHFELGRRDLALKTWQALEARADLHGPERPRVRAALLGAGEALPAQAVLDDIVGLDDFPLRAALLCVAQPGCPPEAILPLLAMTAAAAREHGARGLWLAVQGRRVAALREAGRTSQACEVALAAWRTVEEGVTATEWFPRIGAQLCAALWDGDRALAETIALRSSAGMQQAASTLPPARREY
ncbi:MAG: AAA family ATPase, partial [Piscinibacter sp.]|uniref:ATP-binding protein n=1 Tax=Piscinibacter sp. TaxID=1903157 RepID=UPI003D12919C